VKAQDSIWGQRVLVHGRLAQVTVAESWHLGDDVYRLITCVMYLDDRSYQYVDRRNLVLVEPADPVARQSHERQVANPRSQICIPDPLPILPL
jgi:hypothetical protein